MEEGEESENFRFGSVHGLTNVTVQVGTIAYMHCPVVNLGEREISWVRMKDWRILSHGRKIFTADDRFDLIRDENPEANKRITFRSLTLIITIITIKTEISNQ